MKYSGRGLAILLVGVLSVGCDDGGDLFSPAVSGKFVGSWDSEANINLALVGFTQGDISEDEGLLELQDPDLTERYLIDLPGDPGVALGIYRVVAFTDRDGSADYSLGDLPALGDTCGKYLIYVDDLPESELPLETWLGDLTGLEEGWNGFDRQKGVYQDLVYNGFDLYRTGNCP